MHSYEKKRLYFSNMLLVFQSGTSLERFSVSDL